MLEDRTLEGNLSLIQHQLFDLGAVLAGSKENLIDQGHVTTLEHWIDTLDRELPSLEQFILPRGGGAAAQAHIARAVCRRAERCTFAAAKDEDEVIFIPVLQFLNRLSDYLFVVARTLSAKKGGDILWVRPGERDS
jgi:cob(I)alamin adenosyltransferase